MASNKLMNSKAFINGTSKMSAIFLGGIIFCGLVFIKFVMMDYFGKTVCF